MANQHKEHNYEKYWVTTLLLIIRAYLHSFSSCEIPWNSL